MQGEAILAKMNSAKLYAAALWAASLALLAVGAYQILGNAGLLIAFGSFGIAQAVAQEIRSAIYPIGLVALDTLGEKHAN
jgi:hypothetical protein